MFRGFGCRAAPLGKRLVSIGVSYTGGERMRCTVSVAVTILSLLAASSALHSQTLIRGTVRADSTLTAIHGAFVMLMGVDGSAVASAVSGSDGGFLLHAEPGRFLLHVRRVGYSPTVTPEFEVPAAVADIELTVILPQDALVLDTVAVVGEAEPFAPGPLRGFYERKRRGWGVFLTREEIEAKNPGQVTDIFRNMAGVRVVSKGGRQWSIRMVRASPPLATLFGSACTGTGCPDPRDVDKQACGVNVYIDGALLREGPGIINQMVAANDVEAVEVYRGPAETPADFLSSDSRCGVIVIWTRRAPRQEKKKKKGSGS